MKTNRFYKNLSFVFLSLLPLIVISCAPLFWDTLKYARQYIIFEDEIKIEWNNPVALSKKNLIKSNRIYIRKHGQIIWQFVEEIKMSENPSITVHGNSFSPGKYDIGVSTVTKDDEESRIHSSLDKTAYPPTGWYIFWIMD